MEKREHDVDFWQKPFLPQRFPQLFKRSKTLMLRHLELTIIGPVL